jgi:hypothetical protein
MLAEARENCSQVEAITPAGLVHICEICQEIPRGIVSCTAVIGKVPDGTMGSNETRSTRVSAS